MYKSERFITLSCAGKCNQEKIVNVFTIKRNRDEIQNFNLKLLY